VRKILGLGAAILLGSNPLLAGPITGPSSGAGSYAFSARLRNSTGGLAALWSPEFSIGVR
jgi:hypothetical protein